MSVIGVTTIVRGHVRGEGDLEVLGRVEGSIDVSGHVTIGESGLCRSDVRGRSVTVRGAVAGNLSADDAVVLEPGARVVGDLSAPRVGIRPGALFRGQVDTLSDAAPVAERPAVRARAEAPRAEAARIEPARIEPARAEPPRAEPPRADARSPEARPGAKLAPPPRAPATPPAPRPSAVAVPAAAPPTRALPPTPRAGESRAADPRADDAPAPYAPPHPTERAPAPAASPAPVTVQAAGQASGQAAAAGGPPPPAMPTLKRNARGALKKR
jgi:cytoskeletal protein CcmA (bactofilin family)